MANNKKKYPNKNKNSRRDKYNEKRTYDDRERDRGSISENANHISWYNKFKYISDPAGRLNFSLNTGFPYQIDPNADTAYAMPGIAVLNVAPMFGISNDEKDPLNVAGLSTYSIIRKYNSGGAPYQPADYTFYLMAMDSLFIYHAWMRRLYGTLNMVSAVNRYWPKNIVEAQGVDYEDLLTKQSDFLAYINTFATQASRRHVPSDFTIFNRHAWLFSNYWMDQPDAKGQTYVFHPHGLYRYRKPKTDSQGNVEPAMMSLDNTLSEWNKWSFCLGRFNRSGLVTFDDIINYGNELLDMVWQNQDWSIMSGDTLKAYEGKTFMLPITDYGYRAPLEFNAEVLLQIQNCTPFHFATEVAGVVYHQNLDLDASYITTEVNDGSSSNYPSSYNGDYYRKRIMQSPSMDPTPDEVMINSRLMATFGWRTGDFDRIEYTIKSCGSDVVAGFSILQWESSYTDAYGDIENWLSVYPFPDWTADAAPDAVLEKPEFIAALSKFNFAPKVPLGAVSISQDGSETVQSDFAGYVWNTQNIAVLAEQDLEALHFAALLSMLTTAEDVQNTTH